MVLRHTYSAVLLSGAHVWRASDLDERLPRALLPVANAPLISYSLRWLADWGVADAAICANGDSRLIRRALGSEAFGVDLHHWADRVPRGPAGCASDALALLDGDRIIVAETSLIPTADLGDLLRAHAASGAACSVVVTESPDGGDDASRLAVRPAGVYVFEREALQCVPPVGFYDIKEMLLSTLHAKGAPIRSFVVPRIAPSVRDLASYYELNAWALRRLAEQDTPANYRRVGGALIHRTATVVSGARFSGDVLVGASAVVQRDAIVVGPTAVGSGCQIGAGAVVSSSILWDGAVVPDGARVQRRVVPGSPDRRLEVATERGRRQLLTHRPGSSRLRRAVSRPAGSEV